MKIWKNIKLWEKKITNFNIIIKKRNIENNRIEKVSTEKILKIVAEVKYVWAIRLTEVARYASGVHGILWQQIETRHLEAQDADEIIPATRTQYNRVTTYLIPRIYAKKD